MLQNIYLILEKNKTKSYSKNNPLKFIDSFAYWENFIYSQTKRNKKKEFVIFVF